jgi:hypothetical protein
MDWRPVVALAAFMIPAPVAAHDWYIGLHAPDGSLCCNDTDCHKLDWSQVRRTADGDLELLIGDLWLPVPFEAILSILSPDGHVHACWPRSAERVRCVILPPEA